MDAHLFRVIAQRNGPGFPIPKGGLHTEGKDFVAIILVDRNGVSGGESIVADRDGHIVYRKTLKTPFETLLVDDRRMLHTASPVHLKSSDGHRDIINLDFELMK